MQGRSRDRRLHSFSLVEMLVVMAIMVVCAYLSVPAVFSLIRSSNLTTGGDALASELSLARQVAMSKDCQVEFRFYSLPPAGSSASSTGIYRAFQIFSLDQDGQQTNAASKPIFLPDQIYMLDNGTASSLLSTNSPTSGTVAGISVGGYSPSSYSYQAFHFNPDGSTSLSPISTWFVTLAVQNDPIQGATGLPANFITVQIDPTTSQVRTFRPN